MQPLRPAPLLSRRTGASACGCRSWAQTAHPARGSVLIFRNLSLVQVLGTGEAQGARPQRHAFCRVGADGGLQSPGARVPASLSDWSEPLAWEGALQAAAGSEPPALEALRRSLEGLHILLPDLAPHWKEQLAVHKNMMGIEALLRGLAPPSIPGAPYPAAAGSGSDPGRDTCMYSEAQRAARDLQDLAPFIREYGNRATASCYQHSVWVLTETLMGAARNYCGPGSTLLRLGDLQVAATAVQALRRAHEAHLGAMIRLQVQLAMRLPEVSLRLVQLKAEMADKGLDVSRLVATNLGLLMDLTVVGNAAGAGPPTGLAAGREGQDSGARA